jgi:hypothetical protein
MMHAPLWMANRQPVGTPGFNGTWDNGNSRAPLLRALHASFSAEGDAGVSGAANFTRALEWFAPRFAAWQAAGPGGAAAITDAGVLEAWPRMFAGRGKARIDASAGATQQCTAAGASSTVSPASAVAPPAGDACSNAWARVV